MGAVFKVTIVPPTTKSKGLMVLTAQAGTSPALIAQNLDALDTPARLAGYEIMFLKDAEVTVRQPGFREVFKAWWKRGAL